MVSSESDSSVTSMPLIVRCTAPMTSLSMMSPSIEKPEQARQHAGRLVNQVRAGIADERVVVGLLIAGLHVGKLGVAHARGRTAGQVVESRQLRTRGGKQGLLRASARHRAGAQVRHEAPGAEDCGRSRLDGIDVHESGQALGHFLHERGGERGRRRRAGLPGRQAAAPACRRAPRFPDTGMRRRQISAAARRSSSTGSRRGAPATCLRRPR